MLLIRSMAELTTSIPAKGNVWCDSPAPLHHEAARGRAVLPIRATLERATSIPAHCRSRRSPAQGPGAGPGQRRSEPKDQDPGQSWEAPEAHQEPTEGGGRLPDPLHHGAGRAEGKKPIDNITPLVLSFFCDKTY